MKKSLLLLAAGLALAAAGCVGGVPRTEIRFNPRNDALRIKSPKDVSIGFVTVTQSNGLFSMTVSNYISTNSTAIVGAVAAAQAAVAANALATVQSLSSTATQLLQKAP